MIELNSKQRKFLEKEAHGLSPVVIIGGGGISEGLIEMVNNSLFHHELIKIKFNDYKDEKCIVCGKKAKHKVAWGIQY